ncbi:MAG: hypothetical protein K2G96_01795, partial [Clostridia bacterium]|nr:hypothetical protein [Clostridia bacterium]
YTKDRDVSNIPFCSDVHTIIAKYLQSKQLMNERIQPAELFEFFDENTAEYEELCKILDYSDGDALSGEVAEKYYSDCVFKLNLESLNKQITTLKAKLNEPGNADNMLLAAQLQQLIKQKGKLKSGERK